MKNYQRHCELFSRLSHHRVERELTSFQNIFAEVTLSTFSRSLLSRLVCFPLHLLHYHLKPTRLKVSSIQFRRQISKNLDPSVSRYTLLQRTIPLQKTITRIFYRYPTFFQHFFLPLRNVFPSHDGLTVLFLNIVYLGLFKNIFFQSGISHYWGH